MKQEAKTIIKRTKSSDKDFKKLTLLLDKDLSDRYLKEQDKYNKYNKTDLINTVIVVYNNQIPVGCGCFKNIDNETAEVKRMFVIADKRGLGISKIILTELEIWVIESGYSRIILETGKKQPEAIRLYETSGFKRIPNYGQYADLPNSICFEKNIKQLKDKQ